MALKLGLDAKLSYKVGAGSYNLLTNVKDVTLSLEKAEADVTVRANNGWRAKVGTLRDASLEFKMVWDTADTGFAAIKDAFMNGTVVRFKVMDGTGTGAQGLEFDASILSFTRNEPLEEALTVDVKVAPTYSATAPQWITE